MGLHKIIEEGGEKYLPFALHRMRQLVGEAAANWGNTASRVIYADDGAVIRLSVSGGEQHLRISAGGASYQFFCTGGFVRESDLAGGLGFTVLHGYSVEVGVKAGGTKSKPWGSTIEKDPDPDPITGGRWKYSAESLEMSRMFPKEDVWQINGIPQHTYYVKGPSKAGVAAYPLLVNSWSANKPAPGMNSFSATTAPHTGSIDIGFDAAPSLFQGALTGRPLGDIGVAPDADWYRHAAVCRVVSDTYGPRQFIILTDVANKFYAFPTSAELDPSLRDAAPLAYRQQQIKTNVPGEFTKSVDAPLPAWCRKPAYASRDSSPDAGDGFKSLQYVSDVPQYMWQFNSTASKVCAIVFEDLAALLLQDGSKPVLTGNPNHGEEVRETLPGLVELDLKIEVIGERPQDFTFAVSLRHAHRPSVDGRYFMAAAYAWTVPAPTAPAVPPPTEPPPNVADVDDLIVLTGHVYHTTNERERYGGRVSFNMYAAKGLLRARNLTKGTVVREFLVHHDNSNYLAPWTGSGVDWQPPGAPRIYGSSVLLACDLRVLAFAIQQKYFEQEWDLHPVYGTLYGPPRQFQRLQVYVRNKLEWQEFLGGDAGANSRLAATFADTGVAGMYEYPVNDVGTYDPTFINLTRNPSESVYNTLCLNALEGFYRTLDANGSYLAAIGPYNAGALTYAQMIYPSLGASMGNLREAFTVHPGGGWSIATAPIIYYEGPRPQTGAGAEDIDLSLMRQGRIDLLNLRAGKKDVRTTHLECFNKAFGKALTEDDFRFRFSKHTSTAPGDLFLRFLGVEVPADPVTGVAKSGYIAIGTSYGANYLNPKDPLSIDLRRGTPLYSKPLTISEAVPGTPAGGYVTEPRFASEILTNTPFTRGSSLFF